jgi:hypothetical protein
MKEKPPRRLRSQGRCGRAWKLSPEELFPRTGQRGTAEQWIKEGKEAFAIYGRRASKRWSNATSSPPMSRCRVSSTPAEGSTSRSSMGGTPSITIKRSDALLARQFPEPRPLASTPELGNDTAAVVHALSMPPGILQR